MERKKIVILVVIAVLVLACILTIFLTSFEQPDVNIEDIVYKNSDMNEPSVTLEVTIDIFNPNVMSGTLANLELDVYMDGEFVAFVDQTIDKEIESNAHTDVTFDLVVVNVPLTLSTSFELTIEGEAKLDVFFFSYTAPIKETSTIDIIEEVNNAPIAVIVHDAILITPGMDVNFDGSISSDPDNFDSVIAYEWDFGDGSAAEEGAQVTHSFSKSGSYTVTLSVWDTRGAKGTAFEMIEVIGWV